jgi:glycosyltransferase involved in cell wall biosynthesis
MDIRAMRIALFTGAYNHIADGVSLTLNRLVRFLLENGAQVHVYAPTIARPAIEHAGTLIPLPSISAPGRPEYRIALGLDRRARSDLTAFRPHLFHIATPDLAGASALKTARRLGIPAVATYHTHFASYLDYYRLRSLEGSVWKYLAWFYRQCREVYVPSESMISVIESHGITGNLRLWPRGVDSTLFNPRKRSAEWRRQYGISRDDVVVAFISRLVAEKGLAVVSDVHRLLKNRGIAHRLMFVGDGPEKASLAASNRDAIFTGHQTGEDLAKAYASSDVFLFPSETETFGNVTLEAMSSGLPVVVANATGSSSLVNDGVNGFLAEPRNAESFGERVEQLIASHELRARLGSSARTKAEELEWSAVLSQMISSYERVTEP